MRSDISPSKLLIAELWLIGIREARNILQQLSDSGDVPSSTTYATLMDGRCKESMPEEAKKRLYEIKKKEGLMAALSYI